MDLRGNKLGWLWASIAMSPGAGACGGAIANGPGQDLDGGASPPSVAPPEDGPNEDATPNPYPDASPAEVSPPGECGTDALLIDDMMAPMTDGPGTGGFWYTYSNRTLPTTCPTTIPTPAPPGSINPPEGSPFPPTEGDPTGSPGMRECVGGGEITWGAGFGFNLFDGTEACSAGPLASCAQRDADSSSSVVGESGAAVSLAPRPFDASAHKGITFWAKSNASSLVHVNVQFGEKRTSPWGGFCDPCSADGAMACTDDYLIAESFTANWKEFSIHWTDLKTQNWSKQDLPSGGFDPSTLYSVHFQLPTNSGIPLANFDVAVACIRFVDE